jgi:peptide/nickel transport system substrate-binding protein
LTLCRQRRRLGCVEQVKNNANLKYANNYGSNNQILFNTVLRRHAIYSTRSPSAKIREAMNWAIDRNYISQEIMGGLGKPKYTALTGAFVDYARYADIISAIETKYAYDLDKAKSVISEEMAALGATLGSDGKWQYNGKPVVIIGLIRTEDKRKEIGNYFANQLEALGFTVDRQEKTRVDAGPIWQAEDLESCKFHYYTAGWISQAISRDDGNMFVQYNTGKMQAIPLFGALTPRPELLEPADKLFTNSFTNMEERAELFKTCLELSMQESWWGVWVNDKFPTAPTRAASKSRTIWPAVLPARACGPTPSALKAKKAARCASRSRASWFSRGTRSPAQTGPMMR